MSLPKNVTLLGQHAQNISNSFKLVIAIEGWK